ncbi:uncharacterized protein LOC135084954 [Ostrinia nubilalis]|uniref:uncharacterized protein LOC135084954 n=1 Tax=Ostrinia nubilalis TaxID=29057 RepID=UPI0030826042
MSSLMDSIISKMLEGGVELARHFLKENGYENFTIAKWKQAQQHPDLPDIFGYSVLLEKLLFTGVGDFVVHQLNYSSLDSKLYFDVSFPRLEFSIGKGEAELNFLGAKSSGKAKGQFTIFELRILGEAIFDISDDFDFKLRSVSNLQFKVKAIKTKRVNVKINNIDYSKTVETFLMKTVPEFIKSNETVINENLAKILYQAVHS